MDDPSDAKQEWADVDSEADRLVSEWIVERDSGLVKMAWAWLILTALLFWAILLLILWWIWW